MSEIFEMKETIAEKKDLREIENQIKEISASYEEALSGGFEDIAKTYKEKIEQLKEKIRQKDTSRTTETGHQGCASNEISFGSSDLKSVEQKIKEAGADVDMYTKHLNSDILFKRDTGKSMLDLKYAQKRYAEAIKEKEEILKKG